MSDEPIFLHSFLQVGCNIIICIFGFLICAIWIFVFFDSYIPTKETDALTRLYYIGGIVSGIFAFGAFFVATFTYFNQKKTGDLQRFENTLFNMLNLQQQITCELKYDGIEPIAEPETGKTVKKQHVTKLGREVFGFLWLEKWFYDRYTSDKKIDLLNGTWYGGMAEVLMDKGIKGYNLFTEVAIFDHYFRHLYRMIKFIDETDCLVSKEKYDYTSIVRATLSSYELVWLYYNGLYGKGQLKFKPLMEKYAMLKNLRDELLTISKEVIEKDYFKKYHVILSDYDAHLTDKKGLADKYYLGAFYNERNKNDFSKGKKEYKDNIASKLEH